MAQLGVMESKKRTVCFEAIIGLNCNPSGLCWFEIFGVGDVDGMRC